MGMEEQEIIADLEIQIEHLRDAAERCRKIELAAKAIIGVGAACLGSALLWFKPLALVLGIALLLGGIALRGSNKSTLDEIVARITADEARRAGIIDGLELQTIPPESARLGAADPYFR